MHQNSQPGLGVERSAGWSKGPDISSVQPRHAETRGSAGKTSARNGAKRTLLRTLSLWPASARRGTPLVDFFIILLRLQAYSTHPYGHQARYKEDQGNPK